MINEQQIFEWFEEEKKFLISNLNNHLLMEKKLELLEFSAKVCDEKTHGEINVEDKEKYFMTIFFNPNDTKTFIRFVIGHELVHLLFITPGKMLISGYCSTDNSFAKTNVIRKSQEKTIYGVQFEELLCDYISLEMVLRIYYKEKNDEKLKRTIVDHVYSDNVEPFTKENFEITENIVKNFGKDISELNKFDEFPYEENSFLPNIFLYSIISGDLNLVINDYDNCMGKGAWKLLNIAIDKYFLNNEEKSWKTFIENEIKRSKIIDTIK